jgi:hypothetical protein
LTEEERGAYELLLRHKKKALASYYGGSKWIAVEDAIKAVIEAYEAGQKVAFGEPVKSPPIEFDEG